MFNDFGHITCFIAKDTNRNEKWDKGSEKIHYQFFHTTPRDEALTDLNLENEIKLSESHGYLHVKPKNIDEMIAKEYMKKGNLVYIYDYTLQPLEYMKAQIANPPYSLHFYPGIKKLLVMGY